MIIEALALDVLLFEQGVESNIKGFFLEQSLFITETLGQNILPQEPRSRLFMRDLPTRNVTYNRTVSQTLSFEEDAQPRVSILEVSELLPMWSDQEHDPFAPLVRQTLSLTQSATVTSCTLATNQLVLVQTVDVKKTLNLTVAQTLTLNSGVSVLLPSKYWYSYEVEVIAP